MYYLKITVYFTICFFVSLLASCTPTSIHSSSQNELLQTNPSTVNITPVAQISTVLSTPILPTPITTLTPNEAQALAVELYETNGECQLPCWWGITPGQTQWETAQNILLPLATTIQPTNATSEVEYYVDVKIPVPEKLFLTDLKQTYLVQNKTVEMVEVILGYNSNYELSAFLATHGLPEQIWLSTYDYSYEGSLPFTLLLTYPQKGFAVRYDANGVLENGVVSGCPQKKSALVLVVWPPNKNYTFEEIVEKMTEIGSWDEWDYQPLEKVTNMDIALFFETFIKPDNNSCLETPSEFWKNR